MTELRMMRCVSITGCKKEKIETEFSFRIKAKNVRKVICKDCEKRLRNEARKKAGIFPRKKKTPSKRGNNRYEPEYFCFTLKLLKTSWR